MDGSFLQLVRQPQPGLNGLRYYSFSDIDNASLVETGSSINYYSFSNMDDESLILSIRYYSFSDIDDESLKNRVSDIIPSSDINS